METTQVYTYKHDLAEFVTALNAGNGDGLEIDDFRVLGRGRGLPRQVDRITRRLLGRTQRGVGRVNRLVSGTRTHCIIYSVARAYAALAACGVTNACGSAVK